MKGWDLVALLNEQYTLVENYIELHAIHTKMKRSLDSYNEVWVLTIYMKLLQKSYLNTIHSSVSRLAKNQEEIAHVVDENIWVINITRVEMSENRQALNKK